IAHQIIHMIAVRHRGMATVGTMLVALGMALAIVFRGAGSRVRAIHRQSVLLDRAAAQVVQVAVVQIIDVPFMLDARVATVRPVLVRVVVVMTRHCQSPSWGTCAGAASSSVAWASALSIRSATCRSASA